MLLGLLLGNLIDLDHLFLRFLGKVSFSKSICDISEFWRCNGLFYHPLHNIYVWLFFIISSLIFFYLIVNSKKPSKNKKIYKLFFFSSLGITLHLTLDFIQLITGFSF
jgi:hypothetical protein